MGRVLLVLVTGVPFLVIGVAVGAWWTARTASRAVPMSDRELTFRERMAALDHHTDLLERSRQAALDGEPGLANIYREAADRVLRLADLPPDEQSPGP